MALLAVAGCSSGRVDGARDYGEETGTVTVPDGAVPLLPENGDGGAVPPVDDGGDPLPDPDASAPPPPADGPQVDSSDSKLRDFAFTPGALDGDCNERCTDNEFALLDTRVAPRGQLVMFLLGGDNAASNWREHGRVLASYGFHVAIPAYYNYCVDNGAACDAKPRWRMLTGENVSNVVQTTRGDSAEGRVVTMIKHLMTSDPGGDWGYYLNDDGTLKYDKVIIAGISQGAANAALYGRKVHVARIIMHSGGWNTWGSWLPGAPATPATDQYVFVHTGDGYDSPQSLSVFTGIGVLGAGKSVDNAAPPYDDAHILTTSVSSGYPHIATVADNDSPKQGGQWVLDPAWRYLYGVQ